MTTNSNQSRGTGHRPQDGQYRTNSQSRTGGYSSQSRQTGYSSQGRQTGYSSQGNRTRNTSQSREGAYRADSYNRQGSYDNYGQRRPSGHGGSGSGGKRGGSSRQKAARKKKRIVIFAVEILILAALLGVLYVVFSQGGEGPSRVEISEESLGIEETHLEEEAPSMKGYRNIALFGLDALNEAQLIKGSRSDSIMILSINLDTGDCKLVSVYRDTYLNIGKDSSGKEVYKKANSAYANGGGAQAIQMINRNLDMDINDFVAVSYEGLIAVIDDLGGINIDVDETELKHINNYQISICKERGWSENYTKVTQTGMQKLNGLQASAYCRIRYKAGDDFARAASQREVIMAIEEKLKQCDVKTLTSIVNDVIPHVVTTLTMDEIIKMLPDVGKYSIVAEDGFPQASLRTTANIGSKGSCVIPTDLEANVLWLHQFLFNDQNYSVSDTVKQCNTKIKSDTDPYIK